jgi:predicted CXXCH cytochrome family protein
MSLSAQPLLILALLAASAPARAADRGLAPIPRAQAISSHGPFEMGACDACHARNDPRNPGPAERSNEGCFACHDEFKAAVKIDHKLHPSALATNCVACHSPHNSKNKKLLLNG